MLVYSLEYNLGSLGKSENDDTNGNQRNPKLQDRSQGNSPEI